MSVIETLNTKYFDGGLSQEVLDLLAPLDDERDEVHRFLDRMGRHIHRQELGAHNFSELTAWLIANFIPKLLPEAWNNSVPPITLKGRHALLDQYLTENNWNRIGSGDSMLDLGCGFPPETTMDTAQAYPGLKILGADPSFGTYLIQDKGGNYACFDENHEILYFQASSFDINDWEAVFADPAATKARFLGYLQSASDQLNEFGEEHGSVEIDGVHLQKNPVLQFAGDNLSFVQQGIGSDFDQRFNLIRCMNVLIYFDREFRNRTFEWAAGILEDGGLVMTGMDWAHTHSARIAINQMSDGELRPREIAISIDNLRPFEPVPWFTIVENDYETDAMVEIAHLLRNDKAFVEDFDRRFDELLVAHDFCARKENGCLGGITKETPPDALDRIIDEMIITLVNEGFVDNAVESLNRQGVEAWRNCVGFIAVNPDSLGI